MKSILEALDLVLEDEIGQGWEVYGQATDLYNQLEDAKLHVQNLLHQLHRYRQKMCLDLSYRLRKRNPAFNISVDRHGCKIGYRKKSLTFKPDLAKGMWQVLSKDDQFANLFKRTNKSALLITHDVDEFINTIFTFFKEHYKTLQEDIDGQGVIMIDDKISTLSELARLAKA